MFQIQKWKNIYQTTVCVNTPTLAGHELEDVSLNPSYFGGSSARVLSKNIISLLRDRVTSVTTLGIVRLRGLVI
jgi:hypothetical protein